MKLGKIDPMRLARGSEIVKKGKITKLTPFKFVVKSPDGIHAHLVDINPDDTVECSCPDHTQRHENCKHILAVNLFLDQELNK